MFLVAHEAIEIVAMPQAARAPEKLIDLARSKALLRFKQNLERPFHALDKKQMQMVRHNNPSDLRVAIAIEMLQCFSDDFATFRPPQNAGSAASIEPAFKRPTKASMKLPLHRRGPRLRVKAEPSPALVLPLVAEAFRDEIGEAKGDEIN